MCIYFSPTQMCESFFVPRPSGNSGQVFIRWIGKEDVQVSWAVQMQDLFQLFYIQISPEKKQKEETKSIKLITLQWRWSLPNKASFVARENLWSFIFSHETMLKMRSRLSQNISKLAITSCSLTIQQLSMFPFDSFKQLSRFDFAPVVRL